MFRISSLAQKRRELPRRPVNPAARSLLCMVFITGAVLFPGSAALAEHHKYEVFFHCSFSPDSDFDVEGFISDMESGQDFELSPEEKQLKTAQDLLDDILKRFEVDPFTSNLTGNFDSPGAQSLISNFNSTREAHDLVSKIIEQSGDTSDDFVVIESPRVPNAAAVIAGRGTPNSQRWILYNKGFISRLNRQAGHEWAAMSILAHEIAHHTQGHTTQPGSRPSTELEADERSGFVMRRFNVSLQKAQDALRIMYQGNPGGSATHPGLYDRLRAIERGWMKEHERINVLAGRTRNAPFPGSHTPQATPRPAPPRQVTKGCYNPRIRRFVCLIHPGSPAPTGALCHCGGRPSGFIVPVR